MKMVLYAISASLMLSLGSSAVLAYSGSECEVNDCSKPTKANSNLAPKQDKSKAKKEPCLGEACASLSATKANSSTSKGQDKAKSQLHQVTDFFK